MTRLTHAVAAAFAIIQGLHAANGIAQTYPTRTVRIIAPYAPGGGSDILGRMLGAKVSEELGQPFVIDNRPGGNSTIGTQMIARADIARWEKVIKAAGIQAQNLQQAQNM